MKKLPELFERNRAWAKALTDKDPNFFKNLSNQQSPKYLWIGCSDSRVPANEIVGLLPGEMFVHRNVANLVVHTDLNCLSVIQFAVDVLKVEHIIVCGHYRCGGVQAVVENKEVGLVNNWLRHLADTRDKFATELNNFPTVEKRVSRLCELNVTDQVRNVCQSTIVKDAWQKNQNLTIHGWIYDIADGVLKDVLESPVSTLKESLSL